MIILHLNITIIDIVIKIVAMLFDVDNTLFYHKETVDYD